MSEHSADDRSTSTPRAQRWLFDGVVPALLGLCLALIFWRPLVDGAGFIGGDVYNYYLPLKSYYAQGLRAGELRHWHPGIGNGMPVLGESQTGALYPFHIIAYRLLDLNSAYNAVCIGHYVLAWIFTYWLARGCGVGRWGSLWSALIFVFGWFPPRVCLEWAIVTGCWTPLAVLMTILWLRTGRWRYAWGIALTFAIQLLAGHFQLAFITTLMTLWVVLFWRGDEASWRQTIGRRLRAVVWIVAGYVIAGPQLVPTWELKERSQRQEERFAKTVRYGHVPAAYLIQWVAPFAAYPNAEALLRQLGDDTNKIEAHLYFGAVGLVLAAGMTLGCARHRQSRVWSGMAAVGLALALGWPFEWLADVPGFGFFRYPGRYGLMTQLGVALLVGMAWDRLIAWRPRLVVLAAILFVATFAEFFWVGRTVQYVEMIKPPVIDRLSWSAAFDHLRPEDRVLAMNANAPSLSGAACVPPYLGLNLAAYESLWSRLENVFDGTAKPMPATLEILRTAGVTHILTEAPLAADWPVEPVWSGYDAFLHPSIGRDPSQPLYLYRFAGGPGRAFLLSDDKILSGVRRLEIRPQEATIEVDAPEACAVVLTDVMYPGWEVEVDGKPAVPAPDPWRRVVTVPPGDHQVRWRYVPYSFYRGCGGTMVGLAALMAGSTWSILRRRRSAHG